MRITTATHRFVCSASAPGRLLGKQVAGFRFLPFRVFEALLIWGQRNPRSN